MSQGPDLILGPASAAARGAVVRPMPQFSPDRRTHVFAVDGQAYGAAPGQVVIAYVWFVNTDPESRVDEVRASVAGGTLAAGLGTVALELYEITAVGPTPPGPGGTPWVPTPFYAGAVLTYTGAVVLPGVAPTLGGLLDVRQCQAGDDRALLWTPREVGEPFLLGAGQGDRGIALVANTLVAPATVGSVAVRVTVSQ